MIAELSGADEPQEEGGSLTLLTVLALIVGAISGAGVALFIMLLNEADQLRDALIVRAHAQGPEGFGMVILACAATTAAAASLVRRISPQAVGSGIPQVEAVLNGQLPQARYRIIPVKFVGGVLAIGSGLALGREGPSVHMAATLGHLVGKIFRRTWPDCRVLLAAGAGAGLATAFNAPIAGAIFVLEELVRRFELRVAIAALSASASAISVSRAILGDAPDFHLRRIGHAGRGDTAALLRSRGARRLDGGRLQSGAVANDGDAGPPSRPKLRAALVGAPVGTLAWFLPGLVGGGDPITQRTLLGAGTLGLLPLDFSHEACARRAILFGGDARRTVCSSAYARRAIRIVLRIGL